MSSIHRNPTEERDERRRRENELERKILIGHIEMGAFDINHTYEEYENIKEYVKISKSMTKYFFASLRSSEIIPCMEKKIQFQHCF